MPGLVRTELAAGTLQGSKVLAPEDVAQAIVGAIARPRFDVYVPRSYSGLPVLAALLPRPAREAFLRAIGVGRNTAGTTAEAAFRVRGPRRRRVGSARCGATRIGRSPSGEPLDAEDLERLATAAYMLGRDDEYLDALERAHHAYLEAGDRARAVRCAFWLSMTQLMRGERGRRRAAGSHAPSVCSSARRGDCVERGYLLLPRGEPARHRRP